MWDTGGKSNTTEPLALAAIIFHDRFALLPCVTHIPHKYVQFQPKPNSMAHPSHRNTTLLMPNNPHPQKLPTQQPPPCMTSVTPIPYPTSKPTSSALPASSRRNFTTTGRCSGRAACTVFCTECFTSRRASGDRLRPGRASRMVTDSSGVE